MVQLEEDVDGVIEQSWMGTSGLWRVLLWELQEEGCQFSLVVVLI